MRTFARGFYCALFYRSFFRAFCLWRFFLAIFRCFFSVRSFAVVFPVMLIVAGSSSVTSFARFFPVFASTVASPAQFLAEVFQVQSFIGFSSVQSLAGADHALFCRGYFCVFHHRGFLPTTCCWCFFRDINPSIFSEQFFAGTFCVLFLAGNFSVRSYTGAFSERSLTGAFSVQFLAEVLSPAVIR